MSPKTTPRDFFLHLGAVVALYAAAGALVNLSFSIVDHFLPDALGGAVYGNSAAWPISMLVVLTPLLYLLEWLIARDIARSPEKAGLWIRTWRIYLTLFLAIVLIGGDLIALINTYLNGEITARFICKIIIILFVGGAIGKYYFFSLCPNFKWSKVARCGNAWFGIIFVLAAIITGFIVFGSPAHQRALRFDAQRLSDLQNIQSQIISYWQRNDGLPASNTLASVIMYGSITDPETNAPYSYQPTGPVSFDLCADFGLSSSAEQNDSAVYDIPVIPAGASASNSDWTHPAGQYCFTRTIDPTVYPPQK